jgi:hypothetical protein
VICIIGLALFIVDIVEEEVYILPVFFSFMFFCVCNCGCLARLYIIL